MPVFKQETVTVTTKRFILETPWPQGAAVGELHKMLAVVDHHTGDNDGDTRAWVRAEDDTIVVYIEAPPRRVDPRQRRSEDPWADAGPPPDEPLPTRQEM